MLQDAQDLTESSNEEFNEGPHENVAENENVVENDNELAEIAENIMRDPQERLQELIESMAEVNRDREQIELAFQSRLDRVMINEEDSNQDVERDMQDLELNDNNASVQENDDESFDEEFLDLNSQLDNINTLLNQLEGKSDQLLSNLQALLQDIRQ